MHVHGAACEVLGGLLVARALQRQPQYARLALRLGLERGNAFDLELSPVWRELAPLRDGGLSDWVPGGGQCGGERPLSLEMLKCLICAHGPFYSHPYSQGKR